MVADFLGIKFVPEINIGHLLTVLLILGGIIRSAKGFVDSQLKKFVEEQIAPIKVAAETGAQAAKDELPKINKAIDEIRHEVGELRTDVSRMGDQTERIKRLEDAVYRA